MTTSREDGARPSLIRDGAERYLLLVIVAFAASVVGIRWYLQATGYPQVGGGELHVAHMLWGGLLLVASALLTLVVAARWALTLSAIAAGAGAGLLIDEVGKFITSTNDYFYPLAAPLIYGVLLTIALLFLVVRRRPGGVPAVGRPDALARWETAHLPPRRYRRILIAGLAILGLAWVVSWALYLSLDDASLQRLILSLTSVPGDRVERPSDPLFYWLEVAVLGASGAMLLVGATLLAVGSQGMGTMFAVVGLAIALTAGALLSLYVEQITAIGSTLVNAALLFGVVHYRNRYLDPTDQTQARTATPPHGQTNGVG